ncbi:hypothetical protein PV378_34165, partial [Streptomyces scabiei]|nr:hypothetical protein [Streptomyces scabiei]
RALDDAPQPLRRPSALLAAAFAGFDVEAAAAAHGFAGEAPPVTLVPPPPPGPRGGSTTSPGALFSRHPAPAGPAP